MYTSIIIIMLSTSTLVLIQKGVAFITLPIVPAPSVSLRIEVNIAPAYDYQNRYWFIHPAVFLLPPTCMWVLLSTTTTCTYNTKQCSYKLRWYHCTVYKHFGKLIMHAGVEVMLISLDSWHSRKDSHIHKCNLFDYLNSACFLGYAHYQLLHGTLS